MSFLSRPLMAMIRWYQGHVSPNSPRRCRYQPTCSQYALEAIEVHGALKGTILASWRVLRCNPWSLGGVDWVPEKGHWPTKPLGYTELMEYRKQHEADGNPSAGHGDSRDSRSGS